MDNKPVLYKLKQKQLDGITFAIKTEDSLPTWLRWTGTKMLLGKWTDDSKFHKWDQDEKGWIEIPFKKEDGWRKQFRRLIEFETPTEMDVWDPEARERGMKSISSGEVQFTAGVEAQMQGLIEGERKRGNDPMGAYWMLRCKKTGSEPRDVEYTISFEKARSSPASGSTPSTSVQGYIDAVSKPEDKPSGIRQEIIDAVKHQTNALEDNQIEAYRTQLIEQITGLLKENGIDDPREAESIYENHIKK